MFALPSRAASWMANLFCVCDIFVFEGTGYSVRYNNLCEWSTMVAVMVVWVRGRA